MVARPTSGFARISSTQKWIGRSWTVRVMPRNVWGEVLAHVDIVLRRPTYGWSNPSGDLVVPTLGQMLREYVAEINIFRSRKNWLALTTALQTLLMLPFLVAFGLWYFSWPLFALGFLYGMVLMGSHGTVWYHRFGTHGAFEFRSPIWRELTRNLVIKLIPEEAYIVSHFVHHSKADEPGDPYNPKGGFFYCFLADVNHQKIATDLSEEDYGRACAYVERTGIPMNTYAEYQRWGTIAKPGRLWLHTLLNWGFWFTVFYAIGGPALVCALFGAAFVWGFGVRTFNYGAHGSGRDRRVPGMDFSVRDQSINQYWPGIVAGEWHSNHHLFPRSARSGYRSWQIDLPYYFVRFLHGIGGVTKYHDSRDAFFRIHYDPWVAAQAAKAAQPSRSAEPTSEGPSTS